MHLSTLAIGQRLGNLFDTLFPAKCLLCSMPQNQRHLNDQLNDKLSSSKGYICHHCQLSLPEIHTACSKCCTPLNTDSELCGICIKQERYWQQCTSAFAYTQPIPHLIHQFKYQNKIELIDFFAQSMINSVDETLITPPELLLPVPIHPKRFAKRGYNQSSQLAKQTSLLTGIPYINAFIKNKETPQQASLDKKSREKTLKDNFSIKKRFLPLIKDKHLVIIDDVVTTGATSSELARMLKKAHAKRVDVWCIART